MAGLDPVVAGIIRRALAYTADEIAHADEQLVERRAAAMRALEGVDHLALPTTSFVPTLADVALDPVDINERLGTFTTFANLLGGAAVVIPIGDGSAAALQLLTTGADEDLYAFAMAVERSAQLAGATPRASAISPSRASKLDADTATDATTRDAPSAV